MLRRLVSTSLLLLTACGEPPAGTMSEVPDRFTGAWAANLADCEAGGGPLAANIEPTELRFPDSRLVVTDVTPDGENAARVAGHFTGPGTEWEGSVRLELADGVLSVVNGLPVVPRVKCP